MKTISYLSSRILSASLTLTPILAYAGGAGGPGGGMGTVDHHGVVRLVDTFDGNDNLLSSKEIKEKFWLQENRYVKSPASIETDFFACAQMKFQSVNLAAVRQLGKDLNKIKVMAIEFPLSAIGNEENSDNSYPLPIFANYSDRVEKTYQVPLAAFSHSRVWVVKRLVSRMPKPDRCALEVHEALRFLNFTNGLKEQLTTDEIEMATRFFMSMENPAAKLYVVIKKLKNARPSAMELDELAVAYSNHSKNLGEYRFKNWDKLSTLERNKLESQEWNLLNMSSDFITQAVGRRLDDILASGLLNELGIIGNWLVEKELTKAYGPFKYFDAYQIKDVYRLVP